MKYTVRITSHGETWVKRCATMKAAVWLCTRLNRVAFAIIE